MNKIIQAINLVIFLIITSCVTQVPPTQDTEESTVSTIPNVNEIEKEATKDMEETAVSTLPPKVSEVEKELPKEIAVQEEPIEEAPKLTPSPPLSKNDRMNAVAEGNTAPLGTVYQRDRTPVSTNSFEGQYTVIDFWATWCGPCVKEGPIFHKMGESYKDKNVQFVGVSVDRDFDRWNQFLQQRNWQGNNYWMGMAEEEAFFAFAYSEVELDPGQLGIIVGLPKYVIIGPDGNILHNSSYIKPSNPKFEDLLDQFVK